MEKTAILGYAFMVFALINSTLFIYGFIIIDVVSVLVSLIPVWIWGITAIYLLGKGKINYYHHHQYHGLILSSGFIVFTMFVVSVFTITFY